MIQSLLKPAVYKRVLDEKEIISNASLGDDRYAFYSVMLVHAKLDRARRVLTDYSLYSRLIPYVDRTEYSPETRVLDVEGGIWKWRLRSWVHFDERGERWVRFKIVRGHFQGMEGDFFFESAGEKGTLVYFRGEQLGTQWPPKLVIERGAEIVFGFTAGRMRKYVESQEDLQPAPEAKPSGQSHGQDLPQPRSHL